MSMGKKHLDKFNELYMRVWEWSSEHGRIRWTVVTFFMSVSFAIFGFSLHAGVKESLLIAQRAMAIAVYWFAYLVFMRFHKYTSFLRQYLREMEEQGKTDYDLQSKINGEMRPGAKWKSSEKLLLYFGLIYTIGAVFVSTVIKS